MFRMFRNIISGLYSWFEGSAFDFSCLKQNAAADCYNNSLWFNFAKDIFKLLVAYYPF